MVIFDRLLVAVTKLQSNLLTQDTWISSGSPILALIHSGNLLNYLTKEGTIFFTWANRLSSQLQNPRRLKWSRPLRKFSKKLQSKITSSDLLYGGGLSVRWWKTIFQIFIRVLWVRSYARMCPDVFRQKYGKVLKYIFICELEPNTMPSIKIRYWVKCQIFFVCFMA